MTPDAIDRAARRLAEAGRDSRHIPSLPDDARPSTPAEAHAVQARAAEISGQPVAGWKIATNTEGISTWGAIYAADCLLSPAVLPAGRMPLCGVEGEIAFRFHRDLPSRVDPYSREEIRAALAAFPAIEIVDTRFESYADTPALDRLADRMSNGGLIVGAAEPGAESRDLSSLRVTLACDGQILLDQVGGHSRKDPLLPVIDFVHARQAEMDFRNGQFITAGTLTGIVYGRKGQTYTVRFDGLGAVEVTFS